jgi:hypothetical protein
MQPPSHSTIATSLQRRKNAILLGLAIVFLALFIYSSVVRPLLEPLIEEIATAEGANVIVTWWERNQTSNTPVARISTDGGETFGPMLMLATNGTLTNTEGGGAEGETVEEEAVGGAEVAE